MKAEGIAKAIMIITSIHRYFFHILVSSKEVTAEAGIFKLPITVETGKLGSKNPAGVCIKPPPTMASIKPAARLLYTIIR
jgi:hypothetical protein